MDQSDEAGAILGALPRLDLPQGAVEHLLAATLTHLRRRDPYLAALVIEELRSLVSGARQNPAFSRTPDQLEDFWRAQIDAFARRSLLRGVPKPPSDL